MTNSAERHQSWRLNIKAKVNNFDFKLSATSLFRHCNCSFFQLSLKLKLFRSFLITLNSEPKIPTPTNSRLRRFLERIRIRRRPVRVSSSSCDQRAKFSGISVAWLGGIVGLLSRSVFKKHKDGVFTPVSTSLFCVTTSFFKNFLIRNLKVFMVFLIASVVGFSGIMDFWNHFNQYYDITKLFWKVKQMFVTHS